MIFTQFFFLLWKNFAVINLKIKIKKINTKTHHTQTTKGKGKKKKTTNTFCFIVLVDSLKKKKISESNPRWELFYSIKEVVYILQHHISGRSQGLNIQLKTLNFVIANEDYTLPLDPGLLCSSNSNYCNDGDPRSIQALDFCLFCWI